MNNLIKNTKSKIYNFTSSLVDNEVLDLFLKYQGITMLTTSTLVPIALLMGKDIFKSSVTNTIKLKKKFPVIDDPLVGNYLKLSGLTTVAALTPTTLVPLGIIMLLNNVYKNTYKDKQVGGNIGNIEIPNYFKKIWDNRVFELFIKYQGLKVLTPTTLVPFALILGRDMLENVLQNNDKQTGGGVLPDDLPVIDDPLLGNYLKLMGLSTLTLAPNTLVPLGLLAVLYDVYLK